MRGSHELGLLLQGDDFFVVGDVEVALVVGEAFGLVAGFAGGEVGFVFGVPEDQVGDGEGLGQFAGVFYGAVVFFVGLEDVSVAVEAEGFVEEPGASGDVFFAEGVVGLVAGAAELLAVF